MPVRPLPRRPVARCHAADPGSSRNAVSGNRRNVDSAAFVAVLLACGAGSRFGSHKLLHPLTDGTPMAVASLRALQAVVARTIATVRRGDSQLIRLLREEGAEVIEDGGCAAGMGHSIAAGVGASVGATGWLISLADMPFVEPATIAAVTQGLRDGATICAPCYQGQRGHPVGFSATLRDELVVLRGDQGARSIIERHRHALLSIDTSDPGCLRDIDRPSDIGL